MRRSLAPSQLEQRRKSGNLLPTSVCNSNSCHKNSDANSDGSITIQRLPLFGFLSIPDRLHQQFVVNSGSTITEKTLELRKRKTLGITKKIQLIKPGQLFNKPLGVLSLQQNIVENVVDEEECEEEQLPTTTLPPFERLVLWQDPENEDNKIEVIPELASKLRPHQREGVQFLFECTMGMRGFEGQGCILADDMGLGKTLMSITLLWTLLNQGMSMNKNESAVKKIMVVCPTSLVGNWDNEIRKWVGDKCPTFAVKSEPKKIIKSFLQHRGKAVLIVSYETQRLYSKIFEAHWKSQQRMGSGIDNANDNISFLKHSNNNCCDLLICDEAHKLKNAESGLAKSLNLLPVKKRILLSGTPMQNELGEFFSMVNFCNPMILGTLSEFRKRYERPILAAREPDALPKEIETANSLQKELSTIVNEFILKRGNILNAQHLPPKLVQFVCCRLTPLQEEMYNKLLTSKEIRHVREGKQLNTLNSIRKLINICSHPKMIVDSYNAKLASNEEIDEELKSLVDLVPKASSKSATSSTGATTSKFGINRSSIYNKSSLLGNNQSSKESIDPEQSGKMIVLFRMMQTMRALKNGERIVVVSNYTQTLDLIQQLCEQNNWPALRLDGTISSTKRTKIVDEFNNPMSNAFAFLLSSKAGGCGINLIGGNRLVLYDMDWNPASDKQAMARIWREGQKRRCFIYRFMSTGTIEEKMIERQLSKEGLADIVDDKEQINQFSTSELKHLFGYRPDTRSDTHDTLRCKRCTSVKLLDYSKSSSNKLQSMNEAQTNGVIDFLNEFVSSLKEMAIGGSNNADVDGDSDTVLDTVLASFIQLKEQLQSGSFPSLPAYSKRQREIVTAIDQELSESRVAIGELKAKHGGSFIDRAKLTEIIDSLAEFDRDHFKNAVLLSELYPISFSLQAEFISKWSAIAPELTQLSRVTSTKANSVDDIDEIDEEFVEQEGCPEDTDFNRWSHHCSVSTCDDEVLKRSMADDNTVSFVFGLEVNWSLLVAKQEEIREEVEQRKLKMQAELAELNRKRQQQKIKLTQAETNEDEMVDDDDIDAIMKTNIDEPKKTKGKKNKKLSIENKENISSSRKKKSKIKKVVLSEDESEEDFIEVGKNENTIDKLIVEKDIFSSDEEFVVMSGEARLATDEDSKINASSKRKRIVLDENEGEDIEEDDDFVTSFDASKYSSKHVDSLVHARQKIDSTDRLDNSQKSSDIVDLVNSVKKPRSKRIIDSQESDLVVLTNCSNLSEPSSSSANTNSTDKSWSCVTCTFMNRMKAKVCEMCDAKRPRKGK